MCGAIADFETPVVINAVETVYDLELLRRKLLALSMYPRNLSSW
jgi:hypothetical protein